MDLFPAFISFHIPDDFNDNSIIHHLSSMDNPSDVVVRSSEFKEQGNSFFKVGKFKLAFSKYEWASKLLCFTMPCSLEAFSSFRSLAFALHLNLAACALKLLDYSAVVRFCSFVLQFDSCHIKALYRRASAYQELGKLRSARKDLVKAAKSDPNNIEVLSKLHCVEGLLQDKSFVDHTLKGKMVRSVTQDESTSQVPDDCQTSCPTKEDCCAAEVDAPLADFQGSVLSSDVVLEPVLFPNSVGGDKECLLPPSVSVGIDMECDFQLDSISEDRNCKFSPTVSVSADMECDFQSDPVSTNKGSDLVSKGGDCKLSETFHLESEDSRMHKFVSRHGSSSSLRLSSSNLQQVIMQGKVIQFYHSKSMSLMSVRVRPSKNSIQTEVPQDVTSREAETSISSSAMFLCGLERHAMSTSEFQSTPISQSMYSPVLQSSPEEVITSFTMKVSHDVKPSVEGSSSFTSRIVSCDEERQIVPIPESVPVPFLQQSLGAPVPNNSSECMTAALLIVDSYMGGMSSQDFVGKVCEFSFQLSTLHSSAKFSGQPLRHHKSIFHHRFRKKRFSSGATKFGCRLPSGSCGCKA